MFSIIRIMIGCIVFVVLMKFTKKLKRSARNTITVGISLMLYFVLLFLPFENLFVTFDSPKKAYDYYNLGKSNVVLLVEGDSCDLIVDNDEGTIRDFIIPKTEDGWKIGIGLHSRKVEQKFYNDMHLSISVIRYKNTNEYFIIIENGEKLDISDNHNSEFYFLDHKSDILDEDPYRVYFVHVVDLDSQYRLMINSVELTLSEIEDF